MQHSETMSKFKGGTIELTFRPCRRKSAQKTGRLLVIDPERDGASLANSIVSRACQSVPNLQFETLHRKSQFLGCSKSHEQASLVYEQDIVAALQRLLSAG